jgi:hypothetical protein
VDKAVIGILLITILAIVSITSLSYYIVSQPNQTQDTQTPSPTPTSTPLPEQTPTPKPTVEPSLYDYVVFEWYLKAEYINNVTWLNESLGRVGTPQYYDSSKTWQDNYFEYLSRHIAYPAQAKDDPLVWGYLGRSVFVNAEFDEATGYTKATYQYAEYQNETMLYGIENFLPKMVNDNEWTKNFS